MDKLFSCLLSKNLKKIMLQKAIVFVTEIDTKMRNKVSNFFLIFSSCCQWVIIHEWSVVYRPLLKNKHHNIHI